MGEYSEFVTRELSWGQGEVKNGEWDQSVVLLDGSNFNECVRGEMGVAEKERWTEKGSVE
ncbi:MAG: hypothetical protein NPIRA03_24760 [Nitrospirales bacterium]|nr:MAG: hypothetical protein NPIRA03_24760 [Nitrospirales bacterium]